MNAEWSVGGYSVICQMKLCNSSGKTFCSSCLQPSPKDGQGEMVNRLLEWKQILYGLVDRWIFLYHDDLFAHINLKLLGLGYTQSDDKNFMFLKPEASVMLHILEFSQMSECKDIYYYRSSVLSSRYLPIW